MSTIKSAPSFLMISEILDHVFMNFAADPPRMSSSYQSEKVCDRQSRKTLLNLALCCKTFLDPALDALWWRIQDITNLLVVLPSLERYDTTYALTGPITDDDWSHFDRYAKRIRHLDHVRRHRRVDLSVYIRIQQLRGNAPLLPCLHSLFISPSALFLLSPLLNFVAFVPSTGHGPQPTAPALLDALTDTETYHDLGTLYISTSRLMPPTLKSVININQLHDLVLAEPKIENIAFFAEIGRLKHLERLTITFSPACADTVPNSLTGSLSEDKLFPSLRKLEIRSLPSVHLNTALDKLSDNTPLSSLSISLLCRRSCISNEHQGSGWINLIRTISTKFPRLRELSLKRFNFSPSTGDVPFITYFEPLFTMRKLEVVIFRHSSWIPFSDNDYAKFASAWPRIHIIEFPLIRKEDMPSERPLPSTIEGLQTFAAFCPHLHRLSISFSAKRGEKVNRVPSELSLHRLEILDVGSSPISIDDRNLALRLYKVFPFLSEVFGDGGAFRGKWSCVNALISMYQELGQAENRSRSPELLESSGR